MQESMQPLEYIHLLLLLLQVKQPRHARIEKQRGEAVQVLQRCPGPLEGDVEVATGCELVVPSVPSCCVATQLLCPSTEPRDLLQALNLLQAHGERAVETVAGPLEPEDVRVVGYYKSSAGGEGEEEGRDLFEHRVCDAMAGPEDEKLPVDLPIQRIEHARLQLSEGLQLGFRDGENSTCWRTCCFALQGCSYVFEDDPIVLLSLQVSLQVQANIQLDDIALVRYINQRDNTEIHHEHLMDEIPPLPPPVVKDDEVDKSGRQQLCAPDNHLVILLEILNQHHVHGLFYVEEVVKANNFDKLGGDGFSSLQTKGSIGTSTPSSHVILVCNLGTPVQEETL
mmetsp:Transcript_37518/g.118324  ORF Transcript_37518/g.118324 Transcript_37518/m.118324 type:complete len:339 (-) Transcript_37518:1073-2089(-)